MTSVHLHRFARRPGLPAVAVNSAAVADRQAQGRDHRDPFAGHRSGHGDARNYGTNIVLLVAPARGPPRCSLASATRTPTAPIRSSHGRKTWGQFVVDGRIARSRLVVGIWLTHRSHRVL